MNWSITSTVKQLGMEGYAKRCDLFGVDIKGSFESCNFLLYLLSLFFTSRAQTHRSCPTKYDSLQKQWSTRAQSIISHGRKVQHIRFVRSMILAQGIQDSEDESCSSVDIISNTFGTIAFGGRIRLPVSFVTQILSAKWYLQAQVGRC